MTAFAMKDYRVEWAGYGADAVMVDLYCHHPARTGHDAPWYRVATLEAPSLAELAATAQAHHEKYHRDPHLMGDNT